MIFLDRRGPGGRRYLPSARSTSRGAVRCSQRSWLQANRGMDLGSSADDSIEKGRLAWAQR